MTRHRERLERIENVAVEYLAAKSAAELLQRQMQLNPSYGASFGWLRQGGIAFCANPERTYLVRMYAEFEAGLREYWSTHENETTRPGMYQLVKEALASRRKIRNDDVDDAVRVVLYRNYLVHETEDSPKQGVVPCSFDQAKSFLRKYFYRLNRQW